MWRKYDVKYKICFELLQIWHTWLALKTAKVFALHVDTKATTSIRSNDISRLNTCNYPILAITAQKSAIPNSIYYDISEKIIEIFADPKYNRNFQVVNCLILAGSIRQIDSIEALINRTTGMSSCIVCGYSSDRISATHAHVEAKHLNHRYECHLCPKVTNTWHNYQRHMNRKHKK